MSLCNKKPVNQKHTGRIWPNSKDCNKNGFHPRRINYSKMVGIWLINLLSLKLSMALTKHLKIKQTMPTYRTKINQNTFATRIQTLNLQTAKKTQLAKNNLHHMTTKLTITRLRRNKNLVLKKVRLLLIK